jgi:hypothetical protein
MKFFEWQLVRCRVCCNFKNCVGQVDAEKLAQWSSVAACTGHRLRSSLFVQDQGLAIGVIFPSGHWLRSGSSIAGLNALGVI